MELVLLIVLLVLAVLAYGAVKMARRIYARRDQPSDAERTFLRAMMTKPPAKPEAPYTLKRKGPAPPAAGPEE